MSLRPAAYQLVGTIKLAEQGEDAGLLITDGVGVGKTIAAGYAIAWVARGLGQDVVVVCPVSLVDKWLLELRTKFDLRAERIASTQEAATAKSELRTETARVYVVPYSNVSRIPSHPWGLMVVDEIHNFRNQETRKWAELHDAAGSAKRRIGLSATPINNKVGDLSSIFSILFPQRAPLAVDAVTTGAWETRDFSKFKGMVTRFTKEQLGIHFAKRRIHEVYIDYPNEYREWVLSQVARLTGREAKEGKYPLEAITYYRSATSSPVAFAKSAGSQAIPLDVDAKLEQLKSILSRHEQAIVFCQFRATVDYLAAALGDRPCFKLTGDVPAFERTSILSEFERTPNGLLIMTAVGAEGLDLQFCDVVINYDLHWNPMVLEQRIGRIDRVGQTKQEIHVYNFRIIGSIDERVAETIERKMGLVRGSPLSGQAVSGGDAWYDSEAARIEEQEAADLVAALTAMPPGLQYDYDILESVNEDYCTAHLGGSNNPAEWMRDSETTQAWRADVSKSTSWYDKALQRYEALLG